MFRRPDGKPYDKPKQKRGGQLKRVFKTALQRAGIDNFRPHDCRHTWASWHYMANRDLLTLKELGGWKTLRMVERYALVNRDELRGGIERLPWGIPGDQYSEDQKNIGKTA